MRSDAIIHVVECDDAVRDSISVLFAAMGYATRAFATAAAFLAEERPSGNACLVVDAELPDQGGLELIERLRTEGLQVPAIVITARRSAPIRTATARVGAVLLEKPFISGELIACVERLLAGHSPPRPQARAADERAAATGQTGKLLML